MEQAGFNLVTRLLLDKNYYKGFYWKFEQDYDDDYKAKFRHRYYNRKRKPEKEYKCPICGNPKSRTSINCRRCSNNIRKKSLIVSRETLKEEIRKIPFIQIGKKYGVSDNAIRKWCKKYNLPFKPSEIKKYSDEEWKNI